MSEVWALTRRTAGFGKVCGGASRQPKAVQTPMGETLDKGERRLSMRSGTPSQGLSGTLARRRTAVGCSDFMMVA